MTTTTISKLAELTTNAVIKGLSNKTLNPGNCLVFCTVHGSRAYGTHMPESDWDVKGILILPTEDYLGCFSNVFEQVEFSDKNSPLEFEGVAYELRKILKLASECNPNVIEVLFTDPEHHLVTSTASKLLLENRELFVNKKARHTFAGYAHSQLKRIKSHRSWLLNPPSAPPSREEFGLSPKHKALSKSAQGAFTAFHELHGSQDTSNNQTASERLADGFVAMTGLAYDVAEQAVMLLQLEQNYQNRLNDWKQYQQWLTNRNPARAALEAACGFDCYHEDTEFLTESGWKRFDEITTERLATIAKDTGFLEYENFIDRVKKPHNGKMYELHTQDSLCSITGGHQVLVSPAHRNISNGFSTKYDSNNSSWSLVALEELLRLNRSYFHIRTTFCNKQDDYNVTDDYLRLIGLYVSEGSLLKRKTKHGTKLNGVSISQLEFGRACRIIEQIAEFKYSTHKHMRKGRNELTYNIYSADVGVRLLEDCGEYCKTKKLPGWVSLLSKRQAMILLESLVAGDGTERDSSDVYYTTSPKLADQVQILGMLCEYNTKIWKYDYTETIQVYLKKKPSSTNVLKSKGKSVREVQYDGNVVCFTVPNGTLVTRLRGETSIQGNCKHGMHMVRLLRMCVEILETGKVNVDRSEIDRAELLEVRHGHWTYDQLMEESDRLMALIDTAAKSSKLPESCDKKKIDRLCCELIQMQERAFV